MKRALAPEGVDTLDAVVHYGEAFGNVFWAALRIVVGDGDGQHFGNFAGAPEAIR